MKTCSRCKIEKELSEFYFRNKAMGTYRAECKDCSTERTRANYKEAKDMVNSLKEQLGCAKCGEKRGHVLDFHHIDSKQKEDTIARLTSSSKNIERVMAEIEKCICLCANCHREFHYFEDNNKVSSIEEYLS